MVEKQGEVSGKRSRRGTLRSDPPAVLRQIGERIRELRTARGYSQDRLAYAIPLDRAHIGSIERGIKAPTVITLLRIANTLQVEVGELFPAMSELSGNIPSKDIYGMPEHRRTTELRLQEPHKNYRGESE